MPSPHTESDRSRQPLAVGDRNETGILGAHFYDPYGNGSCASASTSFFALSSRILRTASTCPGAEAKHYFCNRRSLSTHLVDSASKTAINAISRRRDRATVWGWDGGLYRNLVLSYMSRSPPRKADCIFT